ncbi:MAG: RluA family pseudouridine synthase [Pirellulales bacterium]|nr:RluA family pseudouridine synthase [Pirellulales bacterium]
MTHSLQILYEDNHLLAVVKPAGLATMGAAADTPSLWKLAKDYLKRKYKKPGNVYLGVVSRLDSPVSGVALFARTSKAAARLTEQFRSRRVKKIYWTLVEGTVTPLSGLLTHHIARDEANRRMRVVGATLRGARQASLGYRRLKIVQKKLSLVEVELHTGRKHQIRLQLAELGHPIVGDRKYGSRRAFGGGIALHARRLTVEHPVRRENITFEAPLPDAWRRFGVRMNDEG